MKPGGWPTNGKARREPGNLPPAMVKVGLGSGTAIAVGDMFAEPPDALRDLPNDLVSTAGTVLQQAARGRPGSRPPQPTEAGVPASCVGRLRAWPKVGEPAAQGTDRGRS